MGGELAVRWRFRGSTPGPEQWVQSLWQSVLAQYIVVPLSEPSPAGLVIIYQANFQDGYAYLAAESFSGASPSPVMMFGAALFIDYVFRTWNFHKLYLEVAEYNLPQFRAGIGRMFELEGRFREHLWYDGRRWDQVHLALYRDTWMTEGARVMAAVRAHPERRVHVRLPAGAFDER